MPTRTVPWSRALQARLVPPLAHSADLHPGLSASHSVMGLRSPASRQDVPFGCSEAKDRTGGTGTLRACFAARTSPRSRFSGALRIASSRSVTSSAPIASRRGAGVCPASFFKSGSAPRASSSAIIGSASSAPTASSCRAPLPKGLRSSMREVLLAGSVQLEKPRSRASCTSSRSGGSGCEVRTPNGVRHDPFFRDSQAPLFTRQKEAVMADVWSLGRKTPLPRTGDAPARTTSAKARRGQRVNRRFSEGCAVVAQDRIELSTPAFSVRCSTN